MSVSLKFYAKMKRILSLDGGGIRGALTLGYLEKMEKVIQQKENNPNLKLCEYFDLIGGTSTGAIDALSSFVCCPMRRMAGWASLPWTS